MADEDESQKTEEPTARKLAKAKQKGEVSSSQEVKNWAILFGGAIGLALLAPWTMGRISDYVVVFIGEAGTIALSRGVIPVLLTDILIEIGIITAPIFALLTVIALLSSVTQSGFIMAPSKLAPKLNKISLVSGVKRMFSLRSVVEFLKGILKLTVLAFVAAAMAIPWMTDYELFADFDILASLDRLYTIALVIFAGSIMVMFVIAVIDYIYQRYSFTKSMRMSRQEVKDEHKETEGDPQVKARIRKIRTERAQQRMMAAVPQADVVITNPTHYAVALEYKLEQMQAPRLVAKGVDSLAFRIREVAEEHDVPVVENPPLARALYAAVELDEEIPVEHYQAVAEVIGYVMRMKGNRSGGTGPIVH